MSERDEILEEVAQRIEEASILDIAGIWAKRKRAREDADLRRQTRVDHRKELAEMVRSMKGNRARDAISTLASIAEGIKNGERHSYWLIRAWPLAWKGWVDITCCIKVAENQIPPSTDYKIEITEAGQKVLVAAGLWRK